MTTPGSTATPIIVVGIKRSGTKWLSNEIAAHPQVASVQADVHGGIVESNLLTDFGRGFDLSSDEGYERFLEFWRRTHFFHLAEGDVGWFRSLRPRPANSVEALRLLMDALAGRKGKRYWVQKVSPAHARATLAVLTDAKIVVIERSPVDTVRSRIRLDSRRGIETSPLRGGMSQGVHMRQLRRILNRYDALQVQYEALVSDRDRTMEAVYRYLGLQSSGASSQFRPNTSFATAADRDATLGKGGELVVTLTVNLCRIVPMPVLESIQKFLTRGRPRVIPGTYAHEEA